MPKLRSDLPKAWTIVMIVGGQRMEFFSRTQPRAMVCPMGGEEREISNSVGNFSDHLIGFHYTPFEPRSAGVVVELAAVQAVWWHRTRPSLVQRLVEMCEEEDEPGDDPAWVQ